MEELELWKWLFFPERRDAALKLMQRCLNRAMIDGLEMEVIIKTMKPKHKEEHRDQRVTNET